MPIKSGEADINTLNSNSSSTFRRQQVDHRHENSHDEENMTQNFPFPEAPLTFNSERHAIIWKFLFFIGVVTDILFLLYALLLIPSDVILMLWTYQIINSDIVFKGSLSKALVPTSLTVCFFSVCYFIFVLGMKIYCYLKMKTIPYEIIRLLSNIYLLSLILGNIANLLFLVAAMLVTNLEGQIPLMIYFAIAQSITFFILVINFFANLAVALYGL